MSRYFLAIGSLAILAIACSLGGSDTSEQETPDDSPSSGGVPISKATAVPVEDPDEAPLQDPQPTSPSQPTSVPQPTQASTQPPSDDLPDLGDAPVAIIDMNVAGSEQFPKLIALIQNVGNAPLKNIYVTVTFLDSEGNVVEETLGSAFASIIPPGEMSPFDMNFPANVPSTVENVITTLEWIEADADYPWTTEGLEISNTSSEMEFTNFVISGIVHNTTSKTAGFISLLPIAYNAEGKFIGFSLGIVENLAAGSNAEFRIPIGDASRAEPTVDHYEILTVVRYED